MGRTVCTEPQCLYSRAIPLLPLWAVRPVQSLSACTRVHFTFTFYYTNKELPRFLRGFGLGEFENIILCPRSVPRDPLRLSAGSSRANMTINSNY